MKEFSIKKIFLIINLVNAILILSLGLTTYFMFNTQNKLKEKLKVKHVSYEIGVEIETLLKSLDELAVNFIVSLNPEYERNYFNLLDIIYGKKARNDGKIMPLEYIINNSGFTKEEEEKLSISINMLSQLSKIQTKAIHAAKGYTDDGLYNYTIQSSENQQYALSLLVKKEYQIQKEKMLHPVKEFQALIKNRIDKDIKNDEKTLSLNIILMKILSLLILSLLFLLWVVFKQKLINPINQLNEKAHKIAQGNLNIETNHQKNDEIGKLEAAFNLIIKSLTDKEKFVQEIEKGNLEKKFTPISKKDNMGKALLKMRDSLQNAKKEEQKRKAQDHQQNWTNEGIARLNEILRLNTDNFYHLSYSIIAEIVKYLDANQGGLFLINEKDLSDPYIEMVACFAFNRKRKKQKRLEINEGLIGRCIDEAELIYLKQIPENYLEITSGLGDKPPSFLIIVPLKLNEKVFGAIEIASFFDFKEYQIQFIKKISESIASTLNTAKINSQTQHLLQTAKENQEQLSAQEEEMRQNFEELQATQEALDQKDKDNKIVIQNLQKEKEELKGKLNKITKKLNQTQRLQNLLNETINNNYLSIKLTTNGTIIGVNKNFEDLFNQPENKFTNKNYFDIMPLPENLNINALTERLQSDITQSFIQEITIENDNYKIKNVFFPVLTDDNQLKEIWVIAHITQ